jgi:hypothetical protein
MATPTEQALRPGAHARAPGSSAGRGEAPPLAATLALTLALAGAAFAAVAGLVLSVDHPSPLPAPFPPENQDAETLVYLLAFVAVLPGALIAARRTTRAIGAGPNGAAVDALAPLALAWLALAVLALKLCGTLGLPDGVHSLVAMAGVWWLTAGPVLARAARPRPWAPLARLAPLAAPAWALAGILVFGALFSFAFLASISLAGLAIGAAVTAAACAVLDRVALPRVRRPWGAVLDAVAVALVLLAVPDLVVFRPELATHSLAIALETGIIQFHQNLFLGPVNEVMGGHALLVDVASQYGVGDIYALAAWFLVAPIGYGTFSLLTGGMTALWFAGGYGVLRLAGASRLLSAGALAVAVVVLVFNLIYPVGALAQSGPLRFGVPMALLLAVMAGERFPARARGARVAALAVLGLSAIWSLEAFAYTAGVYAAVLAVQAWLRPGARARWLARQAALAGAACVLAHLAFAAATLAATGRLPDWGQYLAYLSAFLTGTVGDLTYDVPRWAPGLAVGAALLLSAAGVIELARRRSPAVSRTELVALTGLTAYAIVLFSYWVDRSLDHILIQVSLPTLLMGALWAGIVARARGQLAGTARRGALAFTLAVAVLLVATAASSIGDRFPRSALAHAAPGGESLRGALDRLWHAPPLNPAAPAGVGMLARYLPGERSSLVMVAPDLGIEILLRSGRQDRLLLADPWEESFAVDAELPRLRARLAGLRPGERMLLDARGRRVLAALRANPRLDPIHATSLPLASLQRYALSRIRARFALRTIARGPDGFSVVVLRRPKA